MNTSQADSNEFTAPHHAELAEVRFKYGEKKCCPKCASDRVRAMYDDEMANFLGPTFAVNRPRKCKNCKHCYELVPSSAARYLLLVIAVMGLFVGVLFILIGGFLPFIILTGDSSRKQVFEILLAAPSIIFTGLLIGFFSYVTIKKYRSAPITLK